MSQERPQPTQIASFHKTKQYAGLVRDQVYAVIRGSDEPITRAEIGLQLPELKQSSITARVNELIKEGSIIVVGTKYDELTNRNVQTLAVAPKAA